MAELDSLSISINAATKPAIDNIDSLIRKLNNLDSTFKNLSSSTTYATNLETAVHSLTRVNNAIANIDAQKLADVAKAMRSLGTAGNTLSNFGSLVQAGKTMDTVSTKAENMAKSLAASFQIKDKEQIDSLTLSIKTMIDTMGKGEAFYAAEDNIKKIIEDYGLFENKLHDVENTYEKVRDIIRQQPLYVPENFSSNANWLSDLATIGIKNTTHDMGAGISAGQLASQLESLIPALQGLQNESDIISTIADHLRDATSESITFAEATKTGQDTEVWYRMDEAVRQMEQSLGIVSPTLEQIEQYLSTINFDSFSTGAQGVEAIREATHEFRDSLQAASTTVQELSNALQQTQQSAQPFDKIVNGLGQLEGITIGDFSNITALADGINKLGYQSAVTASQTLPSIAEGLRSFDGITLPTLSGMEGFAQGLRSLGSKAVMNAANALPFVADGLKQLRGIGTLPKAEGLQEFAQALSVFGRKTSEAAVTNIPKLTKAFSDLFATMSRAPRISQNTIDAANAMANLAARTGSVTSALNHANPSLSLWSSNARKASNSTFSLASAIGKVYASYWMLFRAFGVIKKSIDIASDLAEVKNVVVQAFGDMAYKANEFADIAGESFGMSKLQALDAASRYQAMGKTMGITDRSVAKANDFLKEKLSDTFALKEVQQAYGDLGDTAADMSINLTKLAGDLASLYNTDIDIAAEKLNSIFTGTTKPMREFGFDLTQATLQEWAMKEGLDANVKSMTQAEKALLRYQYVMANADFVMGDFVRTADSWHNVIVKLKLAFSNLGSVIGQGFINLLKPAIQRITAFVNTITGLVQRAINAIGKLLGWQMQIDPVAPLDSGEGGGSGIEDLEDAMDDIGGGAGDTADAMDDTNKASASTASNLDDAQKAAKKMKDYLLGIDELNVFRPQEDTEKTTKEKSPKTTKDKTNKGKGGSGSGSGSGAGSNGGASGGEVSFIPYDSDINSWWELGNRIADTIGNALMNIPWDSIQRQAAAFATNLGEFINGFIDSDIFWTAIGHTIAEALNTALIFAETLIDTVKWGKLGTQLGNLINQGVSDFEWDRLGRTIAKGINAASNFLLNLGRTIDFKKIGEGIAESINNFFETWDSAKTAAALNVWVDNLKQLIISTLKNIKWDEIWKDIVAFFDTIELDTLTFIIGAIAFKWAGGSLKNMVKHAIGLEMGKILAAIKGFTIKDFVLYIANFVFRFQGTPSFDAIIAPIVEKFDEEFSKALPNLSELIGRALTGSVGGGIIGTAIAGPIGTIVGVIIGAIVGAFTDADLRSTFVEHVFNFDLALGIGEDMMRHFREAWNGLIQGGSLLDIGKNIVLGLGKGIVGALVFLAEPIADLFTWIWEGICSLFGISSPAEKMKPLGKNILLGIIVGFKNTISEWTKAITDWYNNSVKPWFTLDKWKGLGENIKQGIISKWNEFKSNWITNITNWFNNNVKPWFTVDKWAAEAQHFKEAIKTKWDETVGQWIIDIANWWNTHVAPWFRLDKWLTEADRIRESIIRKLGEMISEWIPKIQDWWNSHVAPWFKLDTWLTLVDTIRNSIMTKLKAMIGEWIPKITEWWNQNVAPWFKLDTWLELANVIKKSIIDKFVAMVEEWDRKIKDWWDNHVAKWFKLETWTELGDNIKKGILGAIDAVKEEWQQKIEGLLQVVKDVFKPDTFSGIGKEAINALLQGFNSAWGSIQTWAQQKADWLKNIFKIKAEVDTSGAQQQATTQQSNNNNNTKKSTKAGGGIFNGAWHDIQTYAAGGVPDEGQLFWAREQGPELVGTLNGSTAVINNDQIVASVARGVQDAVAQVLSPYLSDISRDTRVIANKDLTVNLGDREIAEVANRGQRSLGAVLFT